MEDLKNKVDKLNHDMKLISMQIDSQLFNIRQALDEIDNYLLESKKKKLKIELLSIGGKND